MFFSTNSNVLIIFIPSIVNRYLQLFRIMNLKKPNLIFQLMERECRSFLRKQKSEEISYQDFDLFAIRNRAKLEVAGVPVAVEITVVFNSKCFLSVQYLHELQKCLVF